MASKNKFTVEKLNIMNSGLHILKYVALFLFSALFLLVFSLWTSPFYKNWYGCDASFFTMAGRGILNGWVPYRDFFDLKGPYFFFIEALGQFLCTGRTGAYIIQIFALFFTLVLMIKTCRMFISAKKTGFIVTIFLAFHAATLWGGNTLEEYMLPLSLLSIYLVLRDMKTYQHTLKISNNSNQLLNSSVRFNNIVINNSVIENLSVIRSSTALIVGLCFGVILFSKITVAAPIIGLVLAIIVTHIYAKRYYNLFEFLIFAFLGVLLSITPIFIYFYLHNMLTDMLYAVFIFAFKRSIDFGTKFNLRWELKISGCYFAIIFVICQIWPRGFIQSTRNAFKYAFVRLHNIRARQQVRDIKPVSSVKSNTKPTIESRSFMLTIIFCIALITAIVLHFGDPFIYYFTTVYPTLMLTFICMFTLYDPVILFRSWRLDVPLVAFLITMSYFASHTATQLNTIIYDRGNIYYQHYVDSAREMASLIPYNERGDVYSFNMDMQWFECNNILPCYTYTINLQFFVALDPRIEENILEKLNTAPPKWLVVGGDLSSYLPNINNVVVKKYENIYENGYGALYILK